MALTAEQEARKQIHLQTALIRQEANKIKDMVRNIIKELYETVADVKRDIEDKVAEQTEKITQEYYISASVSAQIHVYFGDVTWEQSHATTHIGQILLGVSHTQLDSAHTSALLTAQHMTHRRFTLVSAFELKHKHQTDLCATSIVNDETKTMHATQLYKANDRTNKTIVET